MTPINEPHYATRERKIAAFYLSCGCQSHDQQIRLQGDNPTRQIEALESGTSISGYPLICSKCKGEATATIIDIPTGGAA